MTGTPFYRFKTSHLFQISGSSGSGPNRSGSAFSFLLPGPGQTQDNSRGFPGTSAVAFEAELGLRVPHVVLAVQRNVLRPAGRRHFRQTVLRHADEEIRDREDSAQGAMVRPGLLPAGIHR